MKVCMYVCMSVCIHVCMYVLIYLPVIASVFMVVCMQGMTYDCIYECVYVHVQPNCIIVRACGCIEEKARIGEIKSGIVHYDENGQLKHEETVMKLAGYDVGVYVTRPEQQCCGGWRDMCAAKGICREGRVNWTSHR